MDRADIATNLARKVFVWTVMYAIAFGIAVLLVLMVLQLPADVLFDSGSAKLSSGGKATIPEVTRVLNQAPGRRYQVEGHTDNVPIHNPAFRSNWELASARGLGVVRAMIEGGSDAAHASAASYGEFHPVASNDIEDGRHANRHRDDCRA